MSELGDTAIRDMDEIVSMIKFWNNLKDSCERRLTSTQLAYVADALLIWLDDTCHFYEDYKTDLEFDNINNNEDKSGDTQLS